MNIWTHQDFVDGLEKKIERLSAFKFLKKKKYFIWIFEKLFRGSQNICFFIDNIDIVDIDKLIVLKSTYPFTSNKMRIKHKISNNLMLSRNFLGD